MSEHSSDKKISATIRAFLDKGTVPAKKTDTAILPARPVIKTEKKEPSATPLPPPRAAGAKQSSIVAFANKRKRDSGGGGGGGEGCKRSTKTDGPDAKKLKKKKTGKIKLTEDLEAMEIDDDLYDENEEMKASMTGKQYAPPLKSKTAQSKDTDDEDMKAMGQMRKFLGRGDLGPIDGDERFVVPPDRVAAATIDKERIAHEASLLKLCDLRGQARALRKEIKHQESLFEKADAALKEIELTLADENVKILNAAEMEVLQTQRVQLERDVKRHRSSLEKEKAKYEACAEKAVEAREILMEATESAVNSIDEDTIVEDGEGEHDPQSEDAQPQPVEKIEKLNADHLINQLRGLERKEWLPDIKGKFKELLRTSRVGIRGAVSKYQGGANYRDLMYHYYYRSQRGDEYRVIVKWAADDASLDVVPLRDSVEDAPNSTDSWDEDNLGQLHETWPLQPIDCIKDLNMVNDASREAALLGFMLIVMHTSTALECAHALGREDR